MVAKENVTKLLGDNTFITYRQWREAAKFNEPIREAVHDKEVEIIGKEQSDEVQYRDGGLGGAAFFFFYRQ